MQERAQRERLVCLIAGRNFGDNIIWSDLLRELVAAGYAQSYVVWTRPQTACMYQGIDDCEIVCSSFPVGTNKQFGVRQLGRFLSAAARIRARRPTVTLDFVGDFRERIFARLVGGRHLRIGWQAEHPHSRLIRNPFGPGKSLVTVPAEIPNAYVGYRLMMGALLPSLGSEPSSRQRFDLSTRPRGPLRVALHPLASQAYSRWPAERWIDLTDRLLRSGALVTAFGAPAERAQLQGMFASCAGKVAVFAGSIEDFAAEVAKQDLLIGLNSFAVHMAHSRGIPSIMINAGNDPRIWGPPSCTVLASAGGCPTYPCFNAPRCVGSDHQYACINSVSATQVFEAAMGMSSLASGRGERQGIRIG